MPAFPFPRFPFLAFAFVLSITLLPGVASSADDATDTQKPTPAVIERPAVTERSQDEAKGLERQLLENERQTLKAGEESFLVLWRPANTADPRGMVILVPGEGESPAWPQVIGPLRRKLPDAGWQTLSLALPDPHSNLPIARPVDLPAVTDAGVDKADMKDENGNSRTEEGTTVETDSAAPAQVKDRQPPPSVDPIERRRVHTERVMARLRAAIDLAQQYEPKVVVLLGHGTGAYWAARYLAEKEPSEIHNLLMVTAEVPRDFRPPLEEMVPRLKLAIGDFYYRDQAASRKAAKQRMQAGKREKHPAYVQVALSVDSGAGQERLYRRIRGWLDMHLQAGTQQPAE